MASADETRIRLLGLAAFALWALLQAASFVVRPGLALEVATLGIAGALAWPLATAFPDRRRLALAGLFFAVPVLHTWPARAWLGVVEALPRPLPALAGASAIVGLGALVLVGAPRRPRSTLLLATAGLFAGAGVASSLASSAPAESAVAAWLAFGLPILLGLAVARTVRTPRDGGRLLTLSVVAALVPVTAAVAAYVLVEGVPLSGHDLVAGKGSLTRPHLVHEVTFGNPGHIVGLALLLLPAGLVTATQPLRPRAVRAAVALATAGLVIVLTLMLSRIGVAAACAVLAPLALVALLRRQRALAAASAAALVALVAVTASAGAREAFVPIGPDAPPGEAPVDVRGVPVTDGSAVTRIGAWNRALELAVEHAPWGVGTGRYAEHDPVHGGAHSLALQLLVENGILGLLGLLALVAYLVMQALELRRAQDGPSYLVRLASAAGALAFLAFGVVGGAPLAVGTIGVWALLLWLLVGLTESLPAGREKR